MLMDHHSVVAGLAADPAPNGQHHVPAPVDDPQYRTSEPRTFELPRIIWISMAIAYIIFFAALTLATGRDTATLFALTISVAYAVMYFGTAMALNLLSGRGMATPPPGVLETATGLMPFGAVYAQILTVPILLAVFACVIVVIRAVIMP